MRCCAMLVSNWVRLTTSATPENVPTGAGLTRIDARLAVAFNTALPADRVDNVRSADVVSERVLSSADAGDPLSARLP
jgi:hypothetical protein